MQFPTPPPTRRDATDLLNGSCITVTRDLQAHLIALSLLSLLLNALADVEALAEARSGLLRRYNDCDCDTVMNVFGLRLDFVWAPYSASITAFAKDLSGVWSYFVSFWLLQAEAKEKPLVP